jgi:hypothetical protein
VTGSAGVDPYTRRLTHKLTHTRGAG